MVKFSELVFGLALASGSCAASAQLSAPSIVSALPDVRSIGAANAAGVLHYCADHGLVSSSVADTVLDPLTKKEGLTKSADYSAGLSGRIMSGGKSFSIAKAPGYLKSQACDRVLKQAKSLK